jgi:hypothetical protein
VHSLLLLLEMRLTASSGGLGLTGGIVDVGNLFDCLNGVHRGLADDSILTRYSDVRREMWHKVIDPVSTQNLKHLLQDPEVALKEDPLFLNRDQFKDPDFVAKMVAGIDNIMHDFTKEYRDFNASSQQNGTKGAAIATTAVEVTPVIGD